jgi:conjugative transfer signal peptidase TraF
MRKYRPLPLLDWQPPLRRQVRARRRPIFALGGIGLGFLALATTMALAVGPAPRLIWNASASAPIGLWRVHPGAALAIGDMVVVTTPASVRALAATRRYLPANVPLLKQIAALDGDTVCANGRTITINGAPAATRLSADRIGRPLPGWHGCERLASGRIFLLNAAPDSFDGRYFGAVDATAIIGKATPLWLR